MPSEDYYDMLGDKLASEECCLTPAECEAIEREQELEREAIVLAARRSRANSEFFIRSLRAEKVVP